MDTHSEDVTSKVEGIFSNTGSFGYLSSSQGFNNFANDFGRESSMHSSHFLFHDAISISSKS